eukprot:TRINITY_DN74_c0_g1_i5.p1 TRINITY_DN74_c0_g1~~TRINITY_DN74_c0_g1_i5.p1  ORF type:complete len:241 (-),score=65.76 TRINITY_DN74_c0_g1_i5:372-1094(-)
MMKIVFMIASLFAVVGAQYGSSAIAAAAASIDDIVSAAALAAATGEDASAAASAAASDSSASAAASASAGTGDEPASPSPSPLPTKKVVKAPTHTKVLYVPVVKEEENPVIVIKKDKEEKTCDTILEDLLECADSEAEGTIEIPYECLDKTDVSIEDLIECGYVDIAPVPEPEPEPEAPKPMKKVHPVTYKKNPTYSKKTMPEPTTAETIATAAANAIASIQGGESAASVVADVRAAVGM